MAKPFTLLNGEGAVRVRLGGGFDENDPAADGALATLGPSLLAVLHEWMADHHRMLEYQYRPPANRGFGAISSGDVETAAAHLRAIEALQRGQIR